MFPILKILSFVGLTILTEVFEHDSFEQSFQLKMRKFDIPPLPCLATHSVITEYWNFKLS